jgi:hypothetical protein
VHFTSGRVPSATSESAPSVPLYLNQGYFISIRITSSATKNGKVILGPWRNPAKESGADSVCIITEGTFFSRAGDRIAPEFLVILCLLTVLF